MSKRKFKKAKDKILRPGYLEHRAKMLEKNNWPKSKWIVFCEDMMRRGFTVSLYEARKTNSKYCNVLWDDKSFKVRFSDHRPIARREAKGDCDFFVGVTNYQVSNTQQAINATCKFFGVPVHHVPVELDFPPVMSSLEDFRDEDLPWN